MPLMIATQTALQAVEIGDSVLAVWDADNVYFVGTAVEKAEGGFRIIFEDGETKVVAENQIRKNDLEVGSKVFARWADGRFYPGKIAKAVGRVFYIHYDDGDKGWAPLSWIAVKD
ncbi:MAG TPA: hypothetical protein VHC22_06350 [Pirellulales bacterium]|nr:hypothetical protein [Pirellulales bacterium]